jgi:putative transposase
MCMSGISKSQVSRLCAEIDERVNAFLNRPHEGDWPYLWIDATYVKGREVGRIVSKAVIIAVAVNAEGVRELLGMAIGPSEAEPFWTESLRSLTRRGLRGVKLVISDAHEGLKAATAKVLAAINTAFAQESFETASTQWRAVVDPLRGMFPKRATLMNGAEADVLAYLSFPKAHRTQIHGTNPLERPNAEIKRRTDVVGIFPNEASITRLVGALLLEQNDEWQLPRRYISLEALRTLSDNQPARLFAVVS